jgi:hypothetical protein
MPKLLGTLFANVNLSDNLTANRTSSLHREAVLELRWAQHIRFKKER